MEFFLSSKSRSVLANSLKHQCLATLRMRIWSAGHHRDGAIRDPKLTLSMDHLMGAVGGEGAMRVWFVGIVATGLLAYVAIVTQTSASSGPATATASPAPARSSGTRGNVTQARVLSESGRKDNWLVYGGNLRFPAFQPAEEYC